MASLLVYVVDDGRLDDDIPWDSDYDGNGTWTTGWPKTGPDDVSFTGTIKSITEGSSTGETDIRTGNLGDWKTSDSVAGHSWKHNIKHYFLLVTSGRGKGMMCQICNLQCNVDTSDDEEITVPALETDLIAAGVRAGDKFRLVGPGCLDPVSAVEVGGGETMYSWLAVVCENATRSIAASGTVSENGVVGNTITDDDKAWVDDQFASDSGNDRAFVLHISGGTGSPQWRPITANTRDTITVSSWDANQGPPAEGSSFSVYDESGGLHSVIILVYCRDFDPGASDPIAQVNRCKPAYFFNATIWEP
jgi:hypothetical protein